MKRHGLRNFTVRFLDSALQRVETTAKPFYGGRLSTGEAIRRLAEERLEEIENTEAVEENRGALMRILTDWRAGRDASIADLRFLAGRATEAYRRCAADFISKDLLIANVRAFRDAVKASTQHGSARNAPGSRYSFSSQAAAAGKIGNTELLESIDPWVAALPALVTPAYAGQASQNLATFLREEEWPDDTQVSRVLRPHLSSLLELCIRGYWYETHRPLVSPEQEARRGRPRDLPPLRRGGITLERTVGEHELWLAVELPSGHAAVLANDLVEALDLHNVIRLALERSDISGETFRCTMRSGEPGRYTLSSERCRCRLERADLLSIAEALDLLFREATVASLLERGRFLYGRI